MIIAANWKAYVESVAKAKALFASAKRAAVKPGIEIILAPPAPLLGLLVADNKSKVAFAAQDISDTTGGAATGETTAALLSGMGVTYTILGHSERRAMGETDAVVASKVGHALAQGLTPIVCIGERERDPEAHYLQGLRTQIGAVYEPLSPKERMRVVIAYEPIWAIGKDASEAITPHDLQEMVLYIRKVLGDYLPGRASEATKILYGGSVEPGNARELAGGSDINGFLIGHATADVATFTALIKAVS
ncbi:MAG: triosephosphate isomerase [Parcubacteria group bacterium]|nr:triosephosphate isomerase [Parcubacteria group bacterium]